MREQAEIVVPVPIQVLGEQLQQVESWPEFVVGLEQVTPVAHQRFLFGVRQGARLHEILMAVRPNPAQGRYGWTAIDGPRWDGALTIEGLDDARTSVRMVTRVDPRTFLETVAEAFGGVPRRAEHDLHRLHELAVRKFGGHLVPRQRPTIA